MSSVEEASDKMLDALLGQDMYEKRYLILKSGDMRDLFAERGKEFDAWLAALKSLPDASGLPVDQLNTFIGNTLISFPKRSS